MAMTPTARAQAIYDKIALQSNFAKLSDAEKTQLLATIKAIWGDGDLVYIEGSAVITVTGVDPGAGTANGTIT